MKLVGDMTPEERVAAARADAARRHPPVFRDGQRVRHQTFGVGTVKAQTAGKLVVSFDAPAQERTVVERFLSPADAAALDPDAMHRAMMPGERIAAQDLIEQGASEAEAYATIWNRRTRPAGLAGAPVARPKREVRFTAAQLLGMQFAPVRYVVPRYIAEGLTLLAGKPKLGKSWLALDLAVAVARGGYTLGDQHCDGGDALYCALEDNPRRLKERLRKVIGAGSAPERLAVWTEMQTLDAGGEDQLQDWIRAASKPRLIVIDVLNKVRGARKPQEPPYDYDYRSVAPLKAMADAHGLAVVVVHHTRKQAADDELEAVSGTNGLTGAADTILVLSRKSEGVTLYGRGRDIEEIESALQFDKISCRWSVLGEASEVRISAERRDVLDALREAEEPLSPGKIAEAIGKKRNAVDQILRSMSAAGQIKRRGRGAYSLPPQ